MRKVKSFWVLQGPYAYLINVLVVTIVATGASDLFYFFVVQVYAEHVGTHTLYSLEACHTDLTLPVDLAWSSAWEQYCDTICCERIQ